MVIGPVQPRSGPSWKANTIPPTARTDRTEPVRSKRASACSRECGANLTVAASDTVAIATGKANTHRQVALSMMAAEMNNPRIPPAPATPAQVPTARARACAGKLVVITERVTGMIIAAATPAVHRSAIRIGAVDAQADATLVAANKARPATSTGLRPHRSPTAPTGMSSAASARV